MNSLKHDLTAGFPATLEIAFLYVDVNVGSPHCPPPWTDDGAQSLDLDSDPLPGRM